MRIRQNRLEAFEEAYSQLIEAYHGSVLWLDIGLARGTVYVTITNVICL